MKLGIKLRQMEFFQSRFLSDVAQDVGSLFECPITDPRGVFGSSLLRQGGLEEVKREVNSGDVVLFQGFCGVLARPLD